MDLEKLEQIESDYDCNYNRKAVCPYCGYENEIEGEYYGGQDEEQIDSCGNCERSFVRQTDYDVTFCTQPLENYIINELKYRKRQIESYKKSSIENPEVNYYKNALEYFEKDYLEKKNKFEKMLIENHECS